MEEEDLEELDDPCSECASDEEFSQAKCMTCPFNDQVISEIKEEQEER